MRKTLIDTLTQLAKQDKHIVLITGDLGFSVFEDFAKAFPDQFINCGIMEQSMISIAAGLALAGKKPYVYSIIPFATMRPFEQIRNDICYQNLNVKIIGIGAGFAYGALGSTHYAIEDVSILRSLPNITIVSPSDSTETKSLLLQIYKKSGPAYMRINKPEKVLLPKKVKTILSKPSVVENGKDGVIITMGERLETGLEIVKKLKDESLHLKLISMHTLKPINEKAFIKEVRNYKYLYTIEEHRLAGGLASIVAEIICRHNLNHVIVKNFGVDETYPGITGHQPYLAKYHNIHTDYIYQKIIKSMRNGK